MNVERLKKLAEGLLTVVDPKHFNMNLWIDGEGIPGECGTTGCAIGWCPKIFPDDWRYGYKLPRLTHATGLVVRDVEEFFGLSADQCDYLFFESSYHTYFEVTPKMVADRILKLIEDKGEIRG